MGQTIVEKIIARAAGLEKVRVGDIVSVVVDRLMINDLLAPTVFGYFDSLGAKDVARPERILVGVDHRVPPADTKNADNLCRTRQFCRDHKLSGFKEIGRHGIGHQLMCENFTRPYEIAVGTDSHATMYGGVGALACGVNSSDAAVALATGKIWLKVPESARITLHGKLPPHVTAKDIALRMQTLDSTDEFNYKAIEIAGDGAKSLTLDSRLVIANMAVETEAKCCVVSPDESICAYFGIPSSDLLLSDESSSYAAEYDMDLSILEPLAACPHSVSNVKPVRDIRGIPIQQTFIGSCTNGRIEDFKQAAEILSGRQVHPDVRLIIVPASQSVMLEATRLGLIELFLNAGAAIMVPSCASCAGSGPGVLGHGERCVSTTNRNWRGRMGSLDSEVFLASAYVAAASAVSGCIELPSRYLAEGF